MLILVVHNVTTGAFKRLGLFTNNGTADTNQCVHPWQCIDKQPTHKSLLT